MALCMFYAFLGMRLAVLTFVLLVALFCDAAEVDEPTRCEACVLLGREFDDYVMKNKRTETSLIEGMETICNNMMQYKVHKDKEGLARFQKTDSKTMEALKELRDKGVKVNLGLPEELWDAPSVEITELKQMCEQIMESYEDAIELWYWKSGWNFAEGVCADRVLRGGDNTCLAEIPKTEL